MKVMWLPLFICAYLLAFSMNIIPSLKHPDLHLSSVNLLVSLVFVIVFVLFVGSMSLRGMSIKGFKAILLIGFISGLFIFVTGTYESILIEHTVLDILASIRYPVYLLFIVPLFGMNFVFDVGYETFSLFMSVLYILLLATVTARTRKVDSA